MTDPFENLTIDTPEQVELEFEISGIGSRFLAIAIDTLIQAALYVALFLLAAALPSLFKVGRSWGNWWIAFILLGLFCIYWGYFTLFEIFWRGQTPGKRLIGIRVIKDSGRPANTIESIGRNLMRAIDSMPTMYGIGLLTMLINKKNKRLGDLVAGTIVVHERKRDSARPDWTALEGNVVILPGIEQLTPADLELVDLFLQRRIELAPTVRDSSAHRIAQLLRSKLRTDGLPPMSDEDFLQEVVRSARSGAVLRKN